MEKKIIKNGYFLHTIKSKKFKNNTIKIIFKEKYKKDIITYNNLLIDCLTYSTKDYPSKRELAKELEYLYNSYVSKNSSRTGNNMYTSISLEFLDPKYCDQGYLDDVIKVFFDIINNPNIDRDGFEKKNFEICKNNYIKYLETIKEKPAKYAFFRALINMDSNSISSDNADGDIEVLKKITRKELLNTYNHLLKESECHIYVVGNLDMTLVEELIDKYSKKNNNIIVNDELYINNKYKEKVLDVEELDNCNQDILYMIYNLDEMNKYEREIVLPVYNYILGRGGLTSKLYDKVREKNSLCYTIYTYYNTFDSLLFLYAGINSKDKELCVKLIDECFSEMENGEFSDKDLDETKMYLINLLDNSDNSISSIASYNISHDLFNLYLPKDKKELYKKVTKEDIINVSKKIHKNTIYILRGEK